MTKKSQEITRVANNRIAAERLKGAWLNLDAKNLAAMDQILEDKRHPFYEHRVAA